MLLLSHPPQKSAQPQCGYYRWQENLKEKRLGWSLKSVQNLLKIYQLKNYYGKERLQTDTHDNTFGPSFRTKQSKQVKKKQHLHLAIPGVSNTLMRYDLFLTSGKTKVTGIALMPTPRSCSVKRVSV